LSIVAILGGSFDPPHIGHVLAVKYLLATGAADRVVVIPVFEHAFAKPLSPFERRVAWLRAAFENESGVQISEIERDLPLPNYTLNTVRALSRDLPGQTLRLVVGADVLSDVDKWHHFEELVQLAPLLVLGRAGISHPDAPPAVLPQVSSTQVRARLRAHKTHPTPQTAALLRQLMPSATLTAILRDDSFS